MRGYFFCIGAAKAGTTWLYEQLRPTPQLYFAPEKEIHYFFSRYGDFDRLPNHVRFAKLKHFVNRAATNFADPIEDPRYASIYIQFQRTLDWYQTYAAGPVSGHWYRRLFTDAGPNQYACDFSPSTSKISAAGVDAMRKLHKTIKAVYIVRDPLDRLWSHVKFHAQFMGELDEVRTYSRKQIADYITRHRLHTDGFYGDAVRRFRNVLGEQNLLVIDFDEIAANPVGVLDRISQFLDIPTIAPSDKVETAVNVSARFEPPKDALKRFKPKMREQVVMLEEMGYDFVAKWRETLG